MHIGRQWRVESRSRRDTQRETYYHGLPKQYTPDKPIKVYFDNLVIARKYIGPVSPAKRR